MASSPKFVCLVFLSILLSNQIDARESQFFSKVSPTTTNPTTTTTTINNNNNNAKETTVPTKEEDQQPSFLPETQSYGLYSQDSSEIPATTTTKIGNARYTPYSYIPNYNPETNQNQEAYSNYSHTNTNHYNSQYNNNNNNNDADAYEEQQENLGKTSLEENGYTTTSNENNNYYSQGANGYSNPGRQGMSDTRFLDNGKYFYDVKNENNYYPNYRDRARDPEGYYSTDGNSYEYNSERGRYQNQNDFQERQDDQYVP